MNALTSRWISLGPYLKSLLRIMAAFMFLQAGTMKMFGWPMPMPGGQTASLLSQMGIGGLMEVIGGALLLLGLFTRLDSKLGNASPARVLLPQDR